jgi:hypothetical protein
VVNGHPATSPVYEEPFGDDGMESETVTATVEIGKAEPGLKSLGSSQKTSKKEGRQGHKIAEWYRGSDLTEISERGFISGLSSK